MLKVIVFIVEWENLNEKCINLLYQTQENSKCYLENQDDQQPKLMAPVQAPPHITTTTSFL